MPDAGQARSAGVRDEPEKQQVQRSFSRAAGRYDTLASLQRGVAARVFDYLKTLAAPPATVLDLGAGTGYCLRHLGTLYPQAQLIAVDLAEGMLQHLRRLSLSEQTAWLVAGDAEQLPMADGTADLIVSNLALQWCPDLPVALTECARVLAPGGCLVFTTFGMQTLTELRQAWSDVDAYSHVNRFTSLDVLADALSQSGLSTLLLDAELRLMPYPDVLALMGELKGLGAHNVTANRSRSLMGKQRLVKMIDAYQATHATATGGIQASFEVLFGAATRTSR